MAERTHCGGAPTARYRGEADDWLRWVCDREGSFCDALVTDGSRPFAVFRAPRSLRTLTHAHQPIRPHSAGDGGWPRHWHRLARLAERNPTSPLQERGVWRSSPRRMASDATCKSTITSPLSSGVRGQPLEASAPLRSIAVRVALATGGGVCPPTVSLGSGYSFSQ